MNYGKFFRLNRSLSKIEEGIAIYDYVDLPAYFTPSVENCLSPKYPISVSISQSSVSFRLHYCAFKIEGQKDSLENYTHYTYDSDDFKIEKKDKYKSGDDIKVAHMEEVILELPFVENATSTLSDIIKDIYITNFPQMIGGGTSTGGRFLEQLIHKRYPESSEWKSIEKLKKEGDTEALLYGTLREASDDSPSYSTLWLMDLIKDVEGDKNKKRIDLYNKKDGSVVSFLRKLLLDFMFDLKHSDVFQNSSCYQKMYSGLMSDFFFSALMHKCEYYYYRKITSQAINEIEDSKIDKEEKRKRKSAITLLYANELIKAENLWINDIMNPQAEKVFEYKYPGQHPILREFVELYNFEPWPSWFAEPEEEMKRVCFTMKENNGKDHICNAETLIRYLDFNPNNTLDIYFRMSDQIDDNKERVSKWFLKQYAFSDVLHLHLFRYTNVGFLLLIAIPALISLFTLTGFWIIWWRCFAVYATIFLTIKMLRYIYIRSRTTKPALNRFMRIRKIRQKRIREKNNNDHVVLARRKVVTQRGAIFVVSLGLLIILILLREVDPIYTLLLPILLFCLCLVVSAFLYRKYLVEKTRSFTRHLISSLHLLFPRLAASISLAWITLSMGFDLYVSYFDCQLNWYYIICIALIVVVFVMYEINRITPHSSPLRKFLRSVELLIISYFISLFVGVIVINFLGEKYLERGGYMQEYYDQYVNYNDYRNIKLDTDSIKRKYPNQIFTMKSDTITKVDSLYLICQRILAKVDTTKKESISPKADSLYLLCQSILAKVDTLNGADTSSFSRKLVDSLVYVYREKDVSKCDSSKNEDSKQYIAAKERFWGMNVFILRNFLIMFAFIAMFTGIFIQLIIFGDNKQMTEL